MCLSWFWTQPALTIVIWRRNLRDYEVQNNSPVDVAIVVTHDNFAYATRPAPKKPRPNIVEPKAPGEYWLRVHAGELNGWYMCIRRQFDSIKDSWDKQ